MQDPETENGKGFWPDFDYPGAMVNSFDTNKADSYYNLQETAKKRIAKTTNFITSV